MDVFPGCHGQFAVIGPREAIVTRGEYWEGYCVHRAGVIRLEERRENGSEKWGFFRGGHVLPSELFWSEQFIYI